jgi:hypothetical protein
VFVQDAVSTMTLILARALSRSVQSMVTLFFTCVINPAAMSLRLSSPIVCLARIKAQLDELERSHRHRPRSLTGAAISYTLNQWDKLTVYVRDGRVQIDNNLIENTIRPSAIGKKNWLFMGDARSGARAATFYTLIGNCHREGINAEAYLTDIFTRLPGETNQTVHRLIPKAWAAEQAAQKPVKTQSTLVTG